MDLKNKDVINFGSIKVPESWSDISLKTYQEIEAFYDESQDNFNVMDVLHIMIDKDIDYINSLPAEFLDIILDKLSFLTEKPDFGEPTNKIAINNEIYTVHFENQLKVGEYIAADTILKNDKHNYAALLAILCRKDGEIYDSKFENEVIEDRIKLFENQPVLKVMGLIQFFFLLSNLSSATTLLYSNIEEAINLLRQNIDSSRKNGVHSILYTKSLKRKLKKLEKSIKNI